MLGKAATCFADYLELLAAIGDAGEEVTIIGGHAVNLWAELYLEQEPELTRFAPFTSQDLDLHRPGLTARKILRTRSSAMEGQRDPLGKAFTIVEAAFLVRNRAGQALPIETLKMVGGLRADEVRRGTVVVEYQGLRLRVLNPIVLIKAYCIWNRKIARMKNIFAFC